MASAPERVKMLEGLWFLFLIAYLKFVAFSCLKSKHLASGSKIQTFIIIKQNTNIGLFLAFFTDIITQLLLP